MHPVKHYLTITKHRHTVMRYCFRIGLIRQGLAHDLSKYGPQEFWQGAKYWSGKRSPNAAARDEIGWSTAWMHHKGRNKHHYEYWTDLSKDTGTYEAVPMPGKYLAESVMDRIAACKTYLGKNYTDSSALEYFSGARESKLLHPQTRGQLEFLLRMLAQSGEKKTLRFIRKVVLKDIPYNEWKEKAATI